MIAIAPDVVTLASIASRDDSSMAAVIHTLREAVADLSLLILHEANLSPSAISQVVLVGNTVLHCLFHGLPVESLTGPPFRLLTRGVREVPADEIGLALPHAVCYSPSPIESFVGSDAVADIVCAGLIEPGAPSLLVDIGTNTEIILRVNDLILVTSAASGSAFESGSLEFGMLAEPGAIYSVSIDDRLRPSVRVIGDLPPRGICGTGAISAVSEMLNAGIISPLGSFDRRLESFHLRRDGELMRYVLYDDRGMSSASPVSISQIDIRMIQQSKAAVAAAIGTLLRTAGLSVNDITAVSLTGTFGESIDLDSATNIGLLPKFPVRPHQRRGCAVRGAAMILTDSFLRERAERVSFSAQYVDLMNNSLFETLYSSARLFQEFKI